DNVNIKDEHILYISSKVELNKTSDEYNILNKNNITENDLDNIKKEMYEFATKEATTSFIKEKLAIIQQIFQDTDKNFINSLGKLDESITITNHNITHFNKAKKEIKKDLESMLNGIVDEEYKKLSEESKKEKDDIFNGVNREGETKTTGITTEEYYNNNAKIKQWYKNAEDGKWDFQKPLEDIEKYFKSKKLDLYGMFYGKQFLFSMNNDFKSKSEKRKDYDKLNEDLVNAFATYMKNVHAVYSYSQNDKFEVSEILKKHIDSTKTNDYRNIAKDSFKILVDQTNKKIEKKLKEKVFNDSKTNEIINKLSIETKEIKKKYQDKYNILLNINKIKIDNIKISVTHNSDFKISIYKSIKLTMNPFTFAKKAEFGDVAAEEWKEYSSDNYSKMMDDEINIKIKKSAKETKKKINELVDKTITDIETQLEQEKKDKEKHQNKKNDIKEDKEFIQEQFTYLKTNFIKEVEIQNNELYKYNFNQNKIENKTNIKTDTRKVKVIDNFSKIISDIYCCIVKNDMTIKTTELNKLNSFLKRINTLAIKKENFNKNISKSFCDNFFNIQIKNNIIEKCSDKEREVYYGNCFDLATTNGFITKEKENILKQLLIYFDLDESIYQQNINRCTYFSDIVVFYNKTNDNHKIVIKYKHRRYTNQNGLNEKDFTKLSYQIIDKVDDLLPLEIMNIIYIGTKKELNILKRIGRYKEEENNNGIKKINITYKEIQK
ncbi:MAG: hypothetical protein U9Q30_09630, partial [Campylobacterota bacterium]|nr:hypothetical protein [Campylobacterota bacterium]